MKMGSIYCLICPTSGEVRYIGQTVFTLESRLKRHIQKTKSKIKLNKKMSRNEIWIKGLIDIGMESEIKIMLIESCVYESMNEREIYWISEYKKTHKLNNLTDGGNGTRGFHLSEEHKMKISKNRKGKMTGKDHFNYGKKLGNKPWFKLVEISRSDKNPHIGKPKSESQKIKTSIANSGEKNGMFGKRTKRTKEQIEKQRKNMINSQKFQLSRKSKEYAEKISKAFSQAVVVLDEELNDLFEFRSLRDCAEFFGFANHSSIGNAIREYRRIGKSLDQKYWVVKKAEYEESIRIIREKISKSK